MYYPQEVLDQVLANTDIVDVISSHVHLQKKGKDYVGLCPFHNEKTPSFYVVPSKNMYYCFGCGAAGSAITFLMKYNNSPFQEVLQDLADRAKITLPAPNRSEESKKRERHRQDLLAINKEAAVYYYRLLRTKKGARGMRYFTERALTPETMKQFGLGFADGARSDLTAWLRGKGYTDEMILESDLAVFNEKQGLHDRFWNRVIFPIQDVRGRVIGFGGRVLGDTKPKYLNSSDTMIFDKGRNLYALNLARRSRKEYLILCEGYMDVIAMHQAGFTEAVASLGTSFTAGQASLLKRYAKKILLAYDSDGAGVRAALRNIGILRKAGMDTAVIDLRPHKDPDEFIKAEGREAFQARIDNAENSFFYELRILSDSYRMDDPASRTAFHREIAKKLCTFSDEIERENYIAAAAEKYFIRTDALRRLVAQYGTVAGTEEMTGLSRESAGERDAVILEPVSGNTARGMTGGALAAGPSSAGADRTEAGGLPATGAGRTEAGSRAQAAVTNRGRPRIPKATQALWKKQRLLLTWITDQPSIFGQVSAYLGPEDFDGPLFRETAARLWDRMQAGAGTAGELSAAAGIISSFETREQQEAVAEMFNAHMAGIETEADREKTLRELVYSIREASLARRSGPVTEGGGPAMSIQEFLKTKQLLQTLRTAHFKV